MSGDRNLTQHIGCMSQLQHTELLGLSIQELTDLAEKAGQAPYRARQLFDGLYRQRWSKPRAIYSLVSGLSASSFRMNGFTVGLPRIEKKFVSVDGTVRYLLAFADGQSVETVWMPEGDGGEAGDGSESGDASCRNSIPVSS